MRTLATDIVPMYCGSAFKNKGVQAMLDGVVQLLPSPIDVPDVTGTDVDDETVALSRKSDDKARSRPWRSRSSPTRSWAR